MDYYEKYLKYKNKYITLKNLIGGNFEQLDTECKLETNNNQFENCVHCYYQYNINAVQPNIALTDPVHKYKIRNPNKSFSTCTDHHMTEHYFKIDKIGQILKWNNKMFDYINPKDSIYLLNTDIYKGIKSIYFDNIIENKRIYKIKRFTEPLDTLCAEGNIVWVTKNSKVGTTGIDSCMFVVIILEDESKICIHHNILDIYKEYNEVEGKYYFNFSNLDNLEHIIKNSTIGEIKEIYLIGEDIERYETLLAYYLKLKNPLIKIIENGHFIVNNNNEIIKIEKL